jgi:hypothetical protein
MVNMPVEAFSIITCAISLGLMVFLLILCTEFGPKILRFLPIPLVFLVWVALAHSFHERKIDSRGGLGSKIYVVCDTEYTSKCYQVAVVEGKLINLTELGICGKEGDRVSEYSYLRSWSWLTYKDYPSTYHLVRTEQ